MPTANGEQKKSIFSPQEIRNILNVDNKEIVGLCKKASIVPRRDNKGQTFFTYEELVKLKNAQKKSIVLKTNEIDKVDSMQVVNNLLLNLQNMENRINDNVAKVIDEKLEGMDEVVVELIQCKTENETLRQKINELNKQNYQLKTNLNCYKSIGLGLYIKKNSDDFLV